MTGESAQETDSSTMGGGNTESLSPFFDVVCVKCEALKKVSRK
jgi:hypothetical protein